MLSPPVSTNHTLLSGPATTPSGDGFSEGMGYSVIEPPVMTPGRVIFPILLAVSANHTLSSGPGVMPWGWLFGVGRGNSVISPPVVIRPILLPSTSVNHRLPSGPAVMPCSQPPTVGT